MRPISRGEIYWVRPRESHQAGKDVPHPYVVLQETVINQSRVRTVVLCTISTNLKRAGHPGNVLLEAGEGGLPKASVVVVSQVTVVDKGDLGSCIGALSEVRMGQILAGMKLLQGLEPPGR